MLELIEIDRKNPRALRQFVDYPYHLYKDDPNWAPPLKSSLMRALAQASSMQLAGGPFVLFMAREHGAWVGRVLAGINEVKNRQRHCNDGYFSLFECADNLNAARLLLDTASAWLGDRGVERITGPVSPTNGDDYRGFIVDNFDDMPAINTTYTKPWYPRMMQALEWEKYLDFYAFQTRPKEAFVRRVERVSAYTKKKYGIRTSPLDMKHLDAEASAIHGILIRSMLHHWEHLEVPTYEQVREELFSMRALLNPDLVHIARVEQKPVGFVTGIPDYNQVLCHMNGLLTPVNILKFLYYKNKISRVRMFMQFVLPEYQKQGVAITLYDALFQSFLRHHYRDLEGSTIAEFNADSLASVESVGFERCRTYRIYQKHCTDCS